MIEMYDLEGNYICTFNTYLECAKYFKTTRNVIRTHLSLSKQGKVNKKKDIKKDRWVKLYKVGVRMKYKLKDGVVFKWVNEKSKMTYDFNLSDYYNKETRIFEFPKGYVEFSLMSDVFNTLLFPLDLVEKVESDE